MKQTFTLFAFFILSITQSFATHNRGAKIEATFIGGFTYNITITTYTKTSSIQADRPSLDSVHMGDGTVLVFVRDNFQDLPGDIRINTYTRFYTYSGFGHFLIFFSDPNRNAGIINIPNSVTIPLSVETEIFLSPNTCPVNSPHFMCRPSFIFPSGKDITSSFAANSIDHDSLSYSLVSCHGDNNDTIPGYFIPTGISINPFSGEFFWDHNQMLTDGEFNFAVRVDQWRNGVNFGHCIQDFSIAISPNIDPFFDFLSTSNYPLSPDGYFTSTIAAGDIFNLQVEYFDSSGANLELSTEVLTQTHFLTIQNNTFVLGDLSWASSASDAHRQPITFVFRGLPGGNDLTYLLFVTGTYNDTCSSFIGIDDVASQSIMNVYPNPARESLDVTLDKAPDASSRISMIDMRGKIVFSDKIESEKTTINLQDTPAGFYVIRYENSDSSVCKKVVVY